MTLLDLPPNQHTRMELMRFVKILFEQLGQKCLPTKHHSSRVIFLSNQLGKDCGLSERELETLKISASLHDIGKMGISQSIICKKTRLTTEEREEVKRHAVIGANLVASSFNEEVEEIAKVIRHHHENYMGDGYPDGLKGEEIPFMSRIISLLDCYDAISEHRSYHAARGKQEVLNIMAADQEKGKFDPYLYRRFLQLLGTA